MDELLYTVAEAMKMLKMSRTVLYQEIRSGRLDSVQRGRRRLFAADQLQAYVERMKKESGRYGEAA